MDQNNVLLKKMVTNWLQSYHGAAITIDECGVILEAYGAIELLLGYTKNSLEGVNVGRLMPINKLNSYRTLLDSFFNQDFIQISEFNRSLHAVSANGEKVQVRVCLFSLKKSLPQKILILIQPISDSQSWIAKLLSGEGRFQSIIEASPTPMALNDMNGNITYLNQSFTDVFGYTIDDIPTLEHWWPLAYPEKDYRQWVLTEWQHRLDKAHRTQQPFKAMELSINCKNNTRKVAIVDANKLESDFHHEHLITLTDLSAVKGIEKNQKYHSEILEHLSEGIHLVQAHTGHIVYANQSINDMFGYKEGELINQHVSILNSGTIDEQQQKAEEIISRLDNHNYWQGDILNKRKDGSEFWCSASVKVLEHPEYGTCWISAHQDITEQKDFHQRLWRQANYDSLTSLPNRQYFNKRLQQAINCYETTNQAFALAFIDIDDFKEINDSLGHPVGDALLIETASRLEQVIAKNDFIGRFGGDEFIIFIDEIDTKHPKYLSVVTQRLIDAISAPYYINEELLMTSASIGISVYPDDSRDFDSLFKYADQALYEAKKQGKNQVHFFTPELQRLTERNRFLVNAMRSAIEEKQFIVHYQPIIDSHTGLCIKAEALTRWQHPEQGLISPDEFIPVAEDTRLINEIGEIVLEKVIDELQIIRKTIDPDFKISINKSPIQIQYNPMETDVIWPQKLAQAGLPCESIVIEITEGMLLEDKEQVRLRLNNLLLAGFEFAIDDFGTGYSAFAYLTRFKTKLLKIDRSFVNELEVTPNNQVLCQAIIALAHKLNIDVIAEGVETLEQYQILTGMGCDYCQGYYFGKPMPFDEFSFWLEHNKKQCNHLLM